MTKVLPKWEMGAYAELWNRYGKKGFSHEDIFKLLNKKKEVISTLIYDLRKAGWLEVSLHPKDSRKRIYKLIDPEKAIKEMEKYKE